MSVVEVLNVKLQRTDPSVSWGFNVQGGKEFNCPLVIQRVNPGSLAERCSIRPSDYILRIGSLSTEHLTHNQSRDSIVRQGNNLELTLQRGAPPRPDDYAAKLDFTGQHQLMNPESIHQQPLSPQVGLQLGKNKALLTQSYNSPMGLYSSQNIADSLVTSMKNVNVNDPSAIQAAQHMAPKPGVFNTTTSNVHTPNSHMNITTTSFNMANNAQFNSNLNQQQQQHQAQFNKRSIYPPSQNNFSVPVAEFTPVRPPPPPPMAAAVPQPRPSYNQPMPQMPKFQPMQPPRSTPSYSNSPVPPAPKPANGNRVIGGNRGALGSHVMNVANPNHVPTCNTCHQLVRGPFISAIGRVFCPTHFVCQHPSCGINLEQCGFVEEGGKLYCEKDFQRYFAPTCFKCKSTIMGECSHALDKSFHPECFVCVHCKVKLGSGTFHMEDGQPYCPKDFAALFAQKCAGCEFPIEAGDQFFEAINQLWHCECFTCQTCHVQLKASGFCVKGVKPYCKKHAF